jgi:hypothetical protein
VAYTAPTAVSAGDALTATLYNTYVKDNVIALQQSIVRLGHVTRTTDYTTTATTLAGSTDVFATDLSFTADGTSVYSVEAYSPGLKMSSTQDDYVTVNLVKGDGTGVACVGFVRCTTGSSAAATFFARFYYTPSAGTQTLNLRLTCNGRSSTLYGGSGGTGEFDWAPIFLSVFGPDLT